MRRSSRNTLKAVCRLTIVAPCAWGLAPADAGSLIPPRAEVADILLCNSCSQLGAVYETHKTASRPRTEANNRVCSARFRQIPPASKKYSQTKPASCGLTRRLLARHRTPAMVNRLCRKHQAEMTQRL